jgi:multicomponent Na+:H+ antiporter subunit F
MTVEYYLTFFIPFYLISIIMYVIRSLKGPTIPDTVLSIDCLGYALATLLVIFSVYLRSPLIIACAIVLTLWIYALDVYMSKYLEKRELGE